MAKMSLLLTAAMFLLLHSPAAAANYTLTIDGKDHDVELGEKTSIALPDGRSLEVELRMKEFAAFKTGNFTFSYPSRLSPARSDLGDGIFQTTMMTPLGTLVLIQEYTSMNPAPLVGLMLEELTKEERQYGYEINSKPASRTLQDGANMQGLEATSSYKDETKNYVVLAYGGRDAGILVVTQIENGAPQEDRKVLDEFWKTFSITMQ